MGRFLMYLAIGSLGFFVLAAAFVIQAGDGKIAAVRVTSVHDLTLRAPTHSKAPWS